MKLHLVIVILAILGNLVVARYTITLRNQRLSAGSFLHKLRQKRAWKYPPIKVTETPSYVKFQPEVIVTISSDSVGPGAKYELLDNTIGVQQGYFNITPEGNVFQKKPIDREQHANFVIYGTVINSNGQPAEPDPAELHIKVDDLNDNAPEFVTESLINEVPENAGVGSTIMTLKATDADSSFLDYGVVRFYYVENSQKPSSSEPMFNVNSEGIVSLMQSLDRENVDEYTFIVEAKDGLDVPNSPRLVTTGTVTVKVGDVNDNAPVFERERYEARIGELQRTNTIVTTVTADDIDYGVNKAVYFRITGGDEDAQFSFRSIPNEDGPSSGEILIAKPLDFETRNSYILTIEAYNEEAKTNANALTSQASVVITVFDENEPPVFENEPYRGIVPENSKEKIPNVAKVHAVDNDFGGQKVKYSIKNPEGWFEVDEQGSISAIGPADREYVEVNQTNNIYVLEVIATDNDPKEPKSSLAPVYITIVDKNDNAPEKGTGWNPVMCEKPTEAMRANITLITATDKDSALFLPINFEIADTDTLFTLEPSPIENTAYVTTHSGQVFDADQVDKYFVSIRLTDKANQGQPSMTSTQTLTISICRCGDDDKPVCTDNAPTAAAFSVPLLIAIIAAVLILLIIVLAVVAYKRRREAEIEKDPLFDDEDDVRENLQAYHEEGGEEDNDGYDISALQAPPLISPKRQDEPPVGQPSARSRIPPDTDIGDYINDAKNQADNDPTAPPFDSLLVFDYEGQGSDAGSLSSLNSGTTDGSQDYDYLNNWGPRFKKLADMYGGGEED